MTQFLQTPKHSGMAPTVIMAVSLSLGLSSNSSADCRLYSEDIKWIGGIGIAGGFQKDLDLLEVGTNHYAVLGMDGEPEQIVDITDPRQAQIVGVLNQSSGGWRCAVAGTAVVVAQTTELALYDVGNPIAPQLLGTIDLGEGPIDVVTAPNYAYVMGAAGGFDVVRITGAGAPALVGSCQVGGHDSQMSRAGSFVYIGNESGLTVVDVTNAATPTVRLHLAGMRWDVCADGGRLYATTVDQLSIYSLANPAAPALLHSMSLSSGFELAAQGSRLFVAENRVGWTGLAIYDVSDAAHPASLAFTLTYRFPAALAPSGSTLYMTNGWDMQILQLRDLSVASPLSSSVPAFSFGHLSLGPGKQLLDARPQGVGFVSLLDPAHPVALPTLNLGRSVWSVTTQGDYAFVGGTAPGLEVFDISVPGAPVSVATLSLPYQAGALVATGTRLYVKHGSISRCSVIDISNPAAPVPLGLATGTGFTWDTGSDSFAAEGNTVYLVEGPSSGAEGIGVYDLSDPNQASYLWSVPLPPQQAGSNWTRAAVAHGIALFGNAYGLSVYDVSSPALPVLRGHLDLGRVDAIHIEGDLACVSGDLGAQLVDISSAPEVIGSLSLPTPQIDILSNDGFIYVRGSGNSTLLTFPGPCVGSAVDAQAPTQRLVFASFPNPSSSAVSVRFSAPAGSYRLEVIDPAGRRVRSLSDEAMPSRSSVQWDRRDDLGREVPAGVYFLRLVSGGASAVSRQILIR